MNGTLRFTELRRLVPKVSQRMLTQQLRDLERHGLVECVYHPQIPPRVEYGLKRDFQSPACEICLTRPVQITGWI